MRNTSLPELTETENRIYLHIFFHGKATTHQIKNKTKKKHKEVLGALEKLKEKGLIKISDEKWQRT